METINKAKILLIGYGYWGQIWYKTLRKSGYLAVVVDPIFKTQISQPGDNGMGFVNLDGKYGWSGTDELKPFDFTHAIIATPPSTHLEIYKELKEKFNIKDNKILVEKPVGMNYEEAYQMKDCCHNLVWIYDVVYRNVKNIVKSGLLGDILTYQSSRASMGPRIRTDVSIIEDYLFHDIYLYLDMMGSRFRDLDTEISINYRDLRRSHFRDHDSIIKDDTITVGLIDSQGSHFTHIEMFSSWIYPKKERKIVIVGTKGSLIWDNNSIFINNSKYKKFEDSLQKDNYGNIGYELTLEEPREPAVDFVGDKSNLEKLLEDFVGKTLFSGEEELRIKSFASKQKSLVISTHKIIDKIKNYGVTND